MIKVKMFRCVQDPMIGPKPRNAFMLPDLLGWEAWLHPSGNIYITAINSSTGNKSYHVVGMGNWSSIQLYEDYDGKIQDTSGARTEPNNAEVKRPGRPRAQ